MKDPGTKMFSFRLYVDEMNDLAEIAKEERTTVSELVRTLIRARIKKTKKK